MLSVNRIYNKRENRFPIYKDKYQDAGRIAEHYFLQDIYFSKIICQTRSKVHYDIGSRVEGGVSLIYWVQVALKKLLCLI